MPVNFNLAEAGYQCDEKNIDETTADELKMWLDNTFNLYRTYYFWIKNTNNRFFFSRVSYNKYTCIESSLRC